MSSGLQSSSPSPVTNTSSQLMAASATGVPPEAAFAALKLSATFDVAPAVEEAPANAAPKPVTVTGTPTEVPLTVMLLAPRTAVAAIVKFPATMPASSAFTTPCGANKYTLPG